MNNKFIVLTEINSGDKWGCKIEDILSFYEKVDRNRTVIRYYTWSSTKECQIERCIVKESANEIADMINNLIDGTNISNNKIEL